VYSEVNVSGDYDNEISCGRKKINRIQYSSEADLWIEKIIPSCAVGLKLVVYHLLLKFEFKSDTYMYIKNEI